MNEMMYENYMHINIIVHDALVICMSRIVHVAFFMHVTSYNMQWHQEGIDPPLGERPTNYGQT